MADLASQCPDTVAESRVIPMTVAAAAHAALGNGRPHLKREQRQLITNRPHSVRYKRLRHPELTGGGDCKRHTLRSAACYGCGIGL